MRHRRLLIVTCALAIALNIIVWQGIASIVCVVGLSLILWTLRTE